jgi:predicted short-subunit dehydrogenase-like oxidoreductase (DUF2520 family)
MNIVIIGSGNVGTALGHACHRANHKLVQVFSRNIAHAEELAQALEAQPISEWKDLTQDADIYMVALPDAMIPLLHNFFHVDKGMVVHTAGAVSVHALQKVSRNYGVLYPLQSLSKKMVAYSNIPLLVDGNTIEDKTLIADFAATLSGKVAYANDEERLKLHVAGVWANNFTNHMYTIAYDLCQHFQVEFQLLLPMMEHSVGRLHFAPPATFQTGPAIRGDASTLETHLAIMKDYPAYQILYSKLSEAIYAYHKKPKT